MGLAKLIATMVDVAPWICTALLLAYACADGKIDESKTGPKTEAVANEEGGVSKRTMRNYNSTKCKHPQEADFFDNGTDFGSALLGYNIFLADPWGDGPDPGQKAAVLEYKCKLDDGKFGTYDYVNIRREFKCKKDFITQTFKNFKDYAEEKEGSHMKMKEDKKELGFSINLLFFTLSSSTSSSTSTMSKESYKGSRALFEKYQGEIAMSSSMCSTHIVKFTKFSRPMFTRHFIKAMELVQATFNKSRDDQNLAAK